jgi:hypothetical protein
MRKTRFLLKLTVPAAVLATALLSAPTARAVTCQDACRYDYTQCINVWHFPQRDCDVDLTHCLRHCP